MAGALQHQRLQEVKNKLIKPKRAFRKEPEAKPPQARSKETRHKKSQPKTISRLAKELPPVLINKNRVLLESRPAVQTLPQESFIPLLAAESALRLAPNLEAAAAAISFTQPDRDLPGRELHALVAELDPHLAAILRPTPDLKIDDAVASPDIPPETDDLWLATLVENAEQRQRAEPEKSMPTVPEMVVAHIQETILLPNEAVDQTEELLLALPEAMQERLLELVETGEQKQVVAAEELVINIAQAAARLHELAMAERLNEPEADQIRQLLSEWYEQLSVTLDQEPDEQAAAEFIELVCSEDYKPAVEAIEPSIEPAETLLGALPDTVMAKLEIWIDQSAPELTATTNKLIVTIAETADQLHELVMTERPDTPMTEEITEHLRELYTELLYSIDIEPDEKMLAALIEQVCSEKYQSKPAQIETQPFDNSLQERKIHHRIGLSAATKILAYAERATHREIARLMVRLSTVQHSAAAAA